QYQSTADAHQTLPNECLRAVPEYQNRIPLSISLLYLLQLFIIAELPPHIIFSKLPGYPPTACAASHMPAQRFGFCLIGPLSPEVFDPVTSSQQVVVLSEWIETQPQPETLG